MLGIHHTDVTRRHETRTNRYKTRRGIQLLPSKGTSPSHYDAALPPDLRDNTTQDIRPRHQIADRESMPIWYAPWSYPIALIHTWPVPELTPVRHHNR